MDSRQYPAPITPRRQHDPSGNGMGQPPTGSQSWHGSRRPNSSRGRNRRFRGNSRRHPYTPSFDGRGYMSTPRSIQPETGFSMHRTTADLPSSPFAYGADSSVSDEGLLAEPTKVPVVISPNSRERSYTEIMNNAFDLRKSPLSLGKRLAETASPSAEDSKFRLPFDASSSEHSKPEIANPTRRSKRNASSQISPWSKKSKSTYGPGVRSNSGRSNPIAAILDASPVVNQTAPVTVGYVIPQQPVPARSPELANLLEMIDRNTQQSKKLADLVSRYIGTHSAGLQETAPVEKAGGPLYSKELDDKPGPDPSLQPSTLAAGGDSPDPPRDHLNPFRGHMIDSVDILSKSPVKTPERDSNCGPEGISTRQPSPGKSASPNVDRDNDASSIVSNPPSHLSGMMDALAFGALMEDPEYLDPNIYNLLDPSFSIPLRDDASTCSHTSRRWRTSYAPSPDGKAPRTGRSNEESQSSAGGKTPPRPQNSPDIIPKLVKTLGSSNSDLAMRPKSECPVKHHSSSRSKMTCNHIAHCRPGSSELIWADRDDRQDGRPHSPKQQSKQEGVRTRERSGKAHGLAYDPIYDTVHQTQNPQEHNQRVLSRL